MSEIQSASDLKPGKRIRSYRADHKLSLDDLADRLKDEGCDRPSAAKLSRIETDLQPVTPDILPALSKITGIPRDELRPDWAAVLRASGDAA